VTGGPLNTITTHKRTRHLKMKKENIVIYVDFVNGRPDDGGSKHLRNICLLQRDYTALHSRRLSSSLIILSTTARH
jgi:hypothetical protein